MNLKIQEAVNGFIVIDVGTGFGDDQQFRGHSAFPAAWVAETPKKLSELMLELAPINSFAEYREKHIERLRKEFEIATQIAKQQNTVGPQGPEMDRERIGYDAHGRKEL